MSAQVEARARAREPRVELIACESCGGNDRDAAGRTRGQRLLAQLESQNRERGEPVRVSGTRCLWNCKRSCSLHVRGSGRSGYVLADLEASEEMVSALLDWSALYAASADGSVPFRSWPAPMRGHFLCRVPAADISSHASETAGVDATPSSEDGP